MDHLDAADLSEALRRHNLGDLVSCQRIERGNWRQNFAVESTAGRFVFRCQPLFGGQFQIEAEAVSFLAASGVVSVPSPYTLDTSRSVFSWDYAVMPLLDGVPIEVGTIAPGTHLELARSAGDLLGRLHQLDTDPERFPLLAGRGRPGTDPLLKVAENLNTCLARHFLTPAEAEAIRHQLEAWAKALPAGAELRFVHGDYQLSNLLVSAADPGHITALLDFSGSHFGHRAEDLPRQLCMYLDLDPSQTLTRAFLAGYGGAPPARPLFLLCERLDLWVVIKDLQVDWVDQALSFTDWAAPYLRAARHWAAPPPA